VVLASTVVAAASASYPLLLDLVTTGLVEGRAGLSRFADELGARLGVTVPDVSGVGWPLGAALSSLVVAVVALKAGAAWVAVSSAARVVRDVAADLRRDAFAALVASDADRPAREGTGRLVARVGGDVDDVERALETVTTTLVRDGLRSVAVGAVLLVAYPSLVWVALLVVVAVVPLVLALGRRARRAAGLAHAARAELTQRLTETLQGARVVSAHRAAERERARFDDAVTRHRAARLSVDRVRAAQRPITELLAVAALAGTLGLAWSVAGEAALRPGRVVGFVLGLVLLYESLKALARGVTDLSVGWAAADRVRDLLASVPAASPARPAAERPRAEVLRLERVWFRYGADAPWVLRGLDLELHRGRVAALIGASGAGKSTVAGIVAGLYAPTDGRVRVDDERLAPDDLTRVVGFVDQDVFLFEGTLLDNVRYGRPDATDDEARAAGSNAGLGAVAARLPEGWMAPLGERGAGLSGGERQRIALARALLRDAPILVLDEATSALDGPTERDVWSRLRSVADERIVLVIAHRPGTWKQADEVWRLDGGKLVRGRFQPRTTGFEDERLRSTTPRSRAMAPPWPTSATKQSSSAAVPEGTSPASASDSTGRRLSSSNESTSAESA
jgi:ATP-binding cassette subfamily B protein